MQIVPESAGVEKEAMKTRIANISDAGSCNNCQTREQPIVLVVELRTITFRVCWDCAVELSEQLKEEIEP